MIEKFELSPFRKEQIRLQVARAIQKDPTNILIKRDIITEGEYKSKKREPTDVIEMDVFLDYRKTYRKDNHVGIPDGNVTTLATIDLYSVYSDDYTLKFGDYFYLDGMKHIIRFPKEHNEIYWHAKVIVEVPMDKIGAE